MLGIVEQNGEWYESVSYAIFSDSTMKVEKYGKCKKVTEESKIRFTDALI